jgi:acetyltransferase-like isoleucine patch superfamily enzyme
VHIYTHDNLKQTLSGGKLSIEHEAVSIGNCTYIGPQSMITKGVNIGNHCVVASNSFVNKNVDDYMIVAGNPAKVIGRVIVKEDNIEFDYNVK